MYDKGTKLQSKHKHNRIVVECTGRHDKTTFEAKILESSDESMWPTGSAEDYFGKDNFIKL